ncbi:unnamed protein product [Diamesa tonsa]
MYKELFVVLCVVSVMTAHPANQVKNTKVSKNAEIKDNDLEAAESSYGNLNFGRAFGSFGGLGHGLGLGSFGGLGSGSKYYK